ncbi:hypothetical protein [Lentzea sp. CA-135723]|uniref:hypothetical protein n=1 Tax=Lentzea sp. CA-135723 TaxID=3239950 RepID=UPI003D916F6A
MPNSLDVLEAEMADLRTRVRAALADEQTNHAFALRAELVRAERAWHALVQVEDLPLTPPASAGRGAGAALRDRVHQVLTLLTVPAAPRLIDQVCQGVWGVELGAATSLIRDEKRSWQAAPDARAFYVTPTLHHGNLRPVRGLLTLSTWPLEQRITGPVSPLLHRLIVAARVAEALGRLDVAPTGQAELLTRLATDIPGALHLGHTSQPDPRQVQDAAELTLRNHEVQEAADSLIRREAALRVSKLTAAERLFGEGAAMRDTAPVQNTP